MLPQMIKVTLANKRDVIPAKIIIEHEGKKETLIVEQALGQGNSGACFKCRSSSGGMCALKRFFNYRDNDLNQRMLNEIQGGEVKCLDKMQQLIAYGLGEPAESGIYIIETLAPGISLTNLLGDALLGLTDIERIKILRQFLMALQDQIEKGVLNCDIKPDNIMVYRDASGDLLSVRIIDLGLGVVLDNPEDILRSGDFVGTAGYMAPELTRDEKAWSMRQKRSEYFPVMSDQELHEQFILCWDGVGEDTRGRYSMLSDMYAAGYTGKNIMHYDRLRGDDIPEVVAQVLNKMTAINPKDRYKNLSEAIDILSNEIPEQELRLLDKSRYLDDILQKLDPVSCSGKGRVAEEILELMLRSKEDNDCNFCIAILKHNCIPKSIIDYIKKQLHLNKLTNEEITVTIMKEALMAYTKPLSLKEAIYKIFNKTSNADSVQEVITPVGDNVLKK